MLTLNLPPELETRLREEAKKRGISAEQCVRLLLEDRFTPSRASTRNEDSFQKTPEERLRAFHDLVDYLNRLNIQAPPIPLEALRRENLYEDRGL